MHEILEAAIAVIGDGGYAGRQEVAEEPKEAPAPPSSHCRRL
jgi:hypothetical protein